MTRDGTVHDYTDGLADLAVRHVRFIGDPHKRIAEDYLRILRFFRFHAAYGPGGHPDAEGLAACIAGRDGLDQLSRERVRQEMMKLLVAPHALPTLLVMADCGLALRILGGVTYMASFENMAKVEAAIGVQACPVRRLGALAVSVAEDAERLCAKIAADQQRTRAAGVDGGRLAADFAGGRRGRCARADLPAGAGCIYRSRAARLGALAGVARTTQRGTSSRLCRSASPRRCFR